MIIGNFATRLVVGVVSHAAFNKARHRLSRLAHLGSRVLDFVRREVYHSILVIYGHSDCLIILQAWRTRLLPVLGLFACDRITRHLQSIAALERHASV